MLNNIKIIKYFFISYFVFFFINFYKNKIDHEINILKKNFDENNALFSICSLLDENSFNNLIEENKILDFFDEKNEKKILKDLINLKTKIESIKISNLKKFIINKIYDDEIILKLINNKKKIIDRINTCIKIIINYFKKT